MKRILSTIFALSLATSALGADRVTTTSGPIEGTAGADGIRAFKGVPFAAPPVGPLRWQPPQPMEKWTAVRQATAFGA